MIAEQLEELLGGPRAAAQRTAPLTRSERAAYRAVLLAFARGEPGAAAERGPAAEHGAAEDGAAAEHGAASALDRLESLDLIRRDRDGRVVVAYPFSARPTRHRVTLDDGRELWAMCALDALGIPQMLGRAGRIAGSDGIAVELAPGTEPTWTRATAVVLVATAGDGCIADCCCPHNNFYATRAAAERQLGEAAPALRGTVLAMPEAIEGARLLFGDLLGRLSD